jgi:phosphatidylglycerophosphate synthase
MHVSDRASTSRQRIPTLDFGGLLAFTHEVRRAFQVVCKAHTCIATDDGMAVASVPMNSSAPIRRTAEIEESTNLYIIHPIAGRLVPLFARMHVSPNAVSLTGLLFGLSAGFAYYHYQSPLWAVTGFVLMIAWHVMDGADGQLARFTHSQSHLGKVLDGISDDSTFVAVYTALALALRREYGHWMYLLVIAAAACHLVQAATYEAQRQEYDLWGYGRRPPQPARAVGTASVAQELLGVLDRLFYGVLSFPAARVMERIRATMTAALERQPEDEALIRERYRETFAPLLRQWSVLSANYRTLAIFACALLKAPQYYFWFTLIGFNGVMVWLIHRQRERCTLLSNVLCARDGAAA